MFWLAGDVVMPGEVGAETVVLTAVRFELFDSLFSAMAFAGSITADPTDAV